MGADGDKRILAGQALAVRHELCGGIERDLAELDW
jgi:hypothetical protein